MSKLFFISILLTLASLAKANNFEKDTLITLYNGEIIDLNTLKEGDVLLSINITKKMIKPLTLKSIVKSSIDRGLKIKLMDGAFIIVSENTRLLSNNGWLIGSQKDNNQVFGSRSFLNIKQYQTNEFVVCLNSNANIQSVPIESIETIHKTIDCYSLVFETDNNEYAFVANNIFVSTNYNFFE